MSQRTFKIHNLGRAVETRTQRAAAPRKPPKNLLLGGGIVRVVAGKSTPVGERVVRRILAELVKLEEQGALKVTDMQDRRIDLATFEVIADVRALPNVTPEFRLDSAADDFVHEFGNGNHMPQMPGAKAETEEVSVPSIIADAQAEEAAAAAAAAESLVEAPESELGEELVQEQASPTPSVELVDVGGDGTIPGVVEETVPAEVAEPTSASETDVSMEELERLTAPEAPAKEEELPDTKKKGKKGGRS